MAELIKSEVEIDQREDTTKTNGIVSAPVLKEQYAAAYLKNGVTRGITYQIKMLTWVAWKLMRKDDMNDWLLATEVRNARGFHDLVLKYKISNKNESPQYMYRFMQIKLKMSKKTKINMTTLTSKFKNERQFSLIYLFKAYLNLITNFENIKPEQIKDLIIFTNRSIGESLKFLIPVKEDEIIGFEGKGKQYRIDTYMIQSEHRIMMALQQNCSDDGIILGFLNKVVFMVDQPPEPEMEELITEEMGKVFHVPQIFYNDLYKNITEWFLIYEDGGKAPYLVKQDIMQCLTNMHNMLLSTQNMLLKGKSLLVTDSSSELTDKLKRLSL